MSFVARKSPLAAEFAKLRSIASITVTFWTPLPSRTVTLRARILARSVSTVSDRRGRPPGLPLVPLG